MVQTLWVNSFGTYVDAVVNGAELGNAQAGSAPWP